MVKNWLTTSTINSSIPELKGKVGVIEKANEDTSTHVNRLLASDRISYIYSVRDDSLIDLVDDGCTAFSYDESYLLLGDEELVFGVSDTFELRGQNIIFKGEKYPKDTLRTRKVSVVVDDESILDSKELISEEPYYSFYDAQNRKRYILTDDSKEIHYYSDVKKMSIMELTSLPEYNLDMKFLSGYFRGFIIPSDEFFNYINEQFEYASRFLETRAPILAARGPFQELKDTVFTTESDITAFLKKTKSTNRRESMTACTLLKFVFLLHKYRENPVFDFWEKCQESDEFLISYLKDIFNLPSGAEVTKDSKGLFHFTKVFPEYHDVEIPITFRVKSLDSMLQKSLGSASYLTLEDSRDIFASTAYIPKRHKQYTIGIMTQFDLQLTQADSYVKNKKFLDESNVPKESPYKYQRAKGNIKRGRSSSEAFSDAKQTGEHLVDFKHEGVKYQGVIGMENRFLYGTPSADVNETGLTCHPVYEYFAKHFEGEQNRNPFYTASNLSKLFDDFFDYLHLSISKKYPDLNLGQVLKDIDEELGRVNDTAKFPGEKSSTGILKDFYNSKIKVRLFRYFVEKFDLQRMSYGNELVFVSDDNRHQLKVGGRGYKIK